MNCKISEEYLMKYFDGELNDIENAQLKLHLKGCKKCSEDFENLSSVFSYLNTEGVVEPPQDFETNVMIRINTLEAARKRRIEGILLGLYWLATAALAAIAIIFMLGMKELILKTVEPLTQSGVLYAVYYVLKGFYSIIDTVISWVVIVNASLSGLYSYIFVILMFLMMAVKVSQKGFRSNMEPERNQTGNKG